MSTIHAADAPFRLNRPIEHITKLDDGTLLLPVVVTSEAPDDQGEIIDYDGFKAAAPDLMKWAVVSQMHDDGRADTGTILQLDLDDDKRIATAVVHVVDPVAVKKVLARVYKMVSLGGTKLQTRIETHGGRTLRRVVKLRAAELSLVPLGSNPDAMIRKQFILAKAGAETRMDDDRTPEQVAYDAAVELLRKAAADPDVGGGRVRENIPKSDFVFPEDAPDGGFPITSAGDVDDAVSSWGRYKGSRSFDDFKRRLTSIARRKGYPLPKAWQKERKMAKAARRAAAAAEPTTTEEPIAKAAEPADGDGGDDKGKAKGAFPGAKPPFKKKVRKAKLRKMAGVRFAKGKNKTIKMLAEALEAVTCALSEEADEGEAPTVKALTDIANAIHEQMMVEAAEVHPDDDDDMEPMVGDGDESDDDGDEGAIAYAKARRRDADAAPKLRKRLAKTRRTVRSLRKSRRSLRKERRTLRKAAVFTSVLAKAGARHSAADLAKIDAIHEQTVSLGTTSHRLADAVAGEPAPTDVAPDTIAKQAAAASPTFVEQMREALAGLVPADKLDAMERRLVALDERSSAQDETLAKIAAQPMSSGPLTTVLRGVSSDGESTSERGEVLAKAAALIDDPRLRSDVSSAAALEMIQARRTGS